MHQIADGIFYEDAYPGVTLGAIIMPRGTLMIDAPLRAEDARTWKSVLLTQSRGTHRLLIHLDSHTDRTIGARHMDCTVIAQPSKIALPFSRDNPWEAVRNGRIIPKSQGPDGLHPASLSVIRCAYTGANWKS